MSTYQHALYATDLSKGCAGICTRVKLIAESMADKLSIVHVIEPGPAYGVPNLSLIEPKVMEVATARVTELGEKLGVAKADQYIELGSVKTEVLALAERLPIDLIIIGSHGRHGLARLLGSSASAIIHGACCDVITVRCSE